MVEWNRVRGGTGIWPSGAGRDGWRLALSDHAQAALEKLRTWVETEVAPGRLMPWLPIAFGVGIVFYFTVGQEPNIWVVTAVAVICGVGALLARERPFGFPFVMAFAFVTFGFAVATWKTSLISHPVLLHGASGVEIAGFVEVREERERSDRIVVRALKVEGGRLDEAPERIRVSVRKGTAPPVGTYVTFKARLNPPLLPLRPGGYDFARDHYFQRIGASGWVLGSIKIVEAPVEQSHLLRATAAIQRLRDAIDERIRAVAPGDKGAIASALITGKRDAISTPVNDAMYISSLAHVLSISGYHMAVVAGVVFFVVRAFLATVPGFANRRPIKKWAAFAALLAATFYLALSGAEVATQRSFIMAAIVLIGVMVDRAALTLRTLAVAAMAVLVIAPEAVVHPSFQMSFAATLGLIAAYERGLPWMVAGADTSVGARVALWGGREVVALLLASLVAGLATMPYAAFHFHRMAPYGVLANLLAMPIVSIWVMPMGLIGLIAIPFGVDGIFWRWMGDGIDWMIAVALWVADLPGAVGRVAAFDTGPLLAITAGLVVLCLLKSPLRWCGAVIVIAGSIWAAEAPQPDVLIAADANSIAVRGSDGRLSIMRTGNNTFAAREWLAADGDARAANDPNLRERFKCDQAGCIGQLGGGALVSVVRAPAAFEEDCRMAAVVVSIRAAPPGCAALVIDRDVLRTHGAISLRRIGDHWIVKVSRQAGSERQWARRRLGFEAAELPETILRPGVRDATPREDDLNPND